MRITLIALLLAALAVPTLAQEPDRGGILVDYSTAHPAPNDGRFRLEVDYRIAGTPVMLVAHMTQDGDAGVGPRVTHDVGPITIYGHALYGDWSVGRDAEMRSQLKHGGGVEVPIRDGVVFRLGMESTPDAAGDAVRATTVGIGWRF